MIYCICCICTNGCFAGEQCQEGSEFWTDDFTRCVCSSGQLSCSPATCPEGHTCQSASNARPKPFGTCVAHRKPRYTTFDGVNFPFVGPCTYVMTRTCDQGPTAQPLAFSVEVKNEHHGSSSVSSVQQVNVDLKGVHLSMLRKKLNQVMVSLAQLVNAANLAIGLPSRYFQSPFSYSVHVVN